ncbi:bifunctional DNA primase/polymerase [Streptomyces sp. uw30]|uniref:bifunctional DNA primase/polymerase n=1 Tax=Streptomyces sp. uw30 TaxID=1828179 RepID=UPI003967BF40
MATTDRQATTLALAHALSAAERGLAVIPLSRTKLPALRSPHRDDPDPAPCHGECGRFGHGVYDASTNPVRIRELFAAAPWATGYGIACGLPPHHLIGIDLDTKSGTDSSAALRELALRHLFTIPPTVVVLTPSGGRHLWLTGPPEVVVPNSAGRLDQRVDEGGADAVLVGAAGRPEQAGVALALVRGEHELDESLAVATTPRPRLPAATARDSSSSCSPRTRASATPACSGRPAAPTRTASAPPSSTRWSRRPSTPA